MLFMESLFSLFVCLFVLGSLLSPAHLSPRAAGHPARETGLCAVFACGLCGSRNSHQRWSPMMALDLKAPVVEVGVGVQFSKEHRFR